MNILLRWDPPINDGGSPITEYNIQYSIYPLHQDSDFETIYIDANNTSYIINNLLDNTNYIFRVSAINSIGRGNYAEIIYIVDNQTGSESGSGSGSDSETGSESGSDSGSESGCSECVSDTYSIGICGSDSGSESGSESGTDCDICPQIPDCIYVGYRYGFGILTGFESTSPIILTKDSSDNLWKANWTMDKLNCPSYTIEIHIECTNNSFIPVLSTFTCGSASINANVIGLGPINTSNCSTILSFVDFIQTVDENDSNYQNFLDCIGIDCQCQIDCLPVPEPGLIPFNPNFEDIQPPRQKIVPQKIEIIKNININNGAIQYESDNVDVFKIISSETSTLLTCESCSETGQALPNIIQPEVDIYPPLPTTLPCSDEIDVITNIFMEDMNLRITKTRIKVVQIVAPVNITSEISSITTCNGGSLTPTTSIDWNISNSDSSVYQNPNIATMTAVTDVYIDQNGSLMQKKCDIKILKKNNTDTITKPFIALNDCPNVPQQLPADPEPSLDILFDKSSWSDAVGPIKALLDSAADRWATYLKLNSITVESMRRLNKNWNGIALSKLTFINNPCLDLLAVCNVESYYNLPNNKINTLTFNLIINIAKINLINLDLITHELGHAIGIGTLWNSNFIDSSTLSGNIYNNTLNAYNTLINNSIIGNNIIPIEDYPLITAKDKHFEMETRIINGVFYPGIPNEIMRRTNPNNLVLSLISIKNAVDIGYIEKNPGSSEGSPI